MPISEIDLHLHLLEARVMAVLVRVPNFFISVEFPQLFQLFTDQIVPLGYFSSKADRNLDSGATSDGCVTDIL